MQKTKNNINNNHQLTKCKSFSKIIKCIVSIGLLSTIYLISCKGDTDSGKEDSVCKTNNKTCVTDEISGHLDKNDGTSETITGTDIHHGLNGDETDNVSITISQTGQVTGTVTNSDGDVVGIITGTATNPKGGSVLGVGTDQLNVNINNPLTGQNTHSTGSITVDSNGDVSGTFSRPAQGKISPYQVHYIPDSTDYGSSPADDSHSASINTSGMKVKARCNPEPLSNLDFKMYTKEDVPYLGDYEIQMLNEANEARVFPCIYAQNHLREDYDAIPDDVFANIRPGNNNMNLAKKTAYEELNAMTSPLKPFVPSLGLTLALRAHLQSPTRDGAHFNSQGGNLLTSTHIATYFSADGLTSAYGENIAGANCDPWAIKGAIKAWIIDNGNENVAGHWGHRETQMIPSNIERSVGVAMNRTHSKPAEPNFTQSGFNVGWDNKPFPQNPTLTIDNYETWEGWQPRNWDNRTPNDPSDDKMQTIDWEFVHHSDPSCPAFVPLHP